MPYVNRVICVTCFNSHFGYGAPTVWEILASYPSSVIVVFRPGRRQKSVSQNCCTGQYQILWTAVIFIQCFSLFQSLIFLNCKDMFVIVITTRPYIGAHFKTAAPAMNHLRIIANSPEYISQYPSQKALFVLFRINTAYCTG